MNNIKHNSSPESSNKDRDNKWDILNEDKKSEKINAVSSFGATSGEYYENDADFQRLVDEYPDIFTINSKEAIDELLQQYINIWEKLEDEREQVEEIMRLRQSENFDNVRMADTLTVAFLASKKMYNIDADYKLDLAYLTDGGTYVAGYYEPNEHKIYLHRDKREFNWATRDIRHELDICEHLAHETWHAFQYAAIEDDENEQGLKYLINFMHYQEAKGPRSDILIPKFNNPYEQQLVEREAYVAGIAFRSFCESIL